MANKSERQLRQFVSVVICSDGGVGGSAQPKRQGIYNLIGNAQSLINDLLATICLMKKRRS